MLQQPQEPQQQKPQNPKEWYGTEDGKTITLHFWGGVQPEYGYDDLCANFNEEYKDKGLLGRICKICK